MSLVDVIIPTYRGIPPEALQSLTKMLQDTNCMCRDENGTPLHLPWKCTNKKHSVRLMPPLFQSSVVHWARNQAIAQGMYGQPKDGRPPAQYFLLMDDDMLSQPHYLSRLLSYKLDIVCGICTIRRDPPFPNIRFWHPEEKMFRPPIEWDWDSQKLMEVDAAGAAYMLVKRTVLETMSEAYLNCWFEIREDSRKFKGTSVSSYWEKRAVERKKRFEEAREQGNWSARDGWWFQFLSNVVDGQIGELGEDIGFCWKAKQLGFRIFADPQVLPGHLGMYGYSIEDYRDEVERAKKMNPNLQLPENHPALEAEVCPQ